MLPYKAYYEVLDRFVSSGARLKVPATVNPRPGRDFSLINRAVFSRQKRLENAYTSIGVTPNWSCVCYLSANVPSRGDRLGWAESSAVVFANSVLGARTNRNSILVDVCGGVAGCVPEFGYLLDENRRGTVLVKLDVQRMDPAALGFVIGRSVVDGVPVLTNHPFDIVELKNMGAAMAASGGVALFHVEGVTPEAPDIKTAFGGAQYREITIRQSDLDAIRTKKSGDADLVAFGCPQMTCDEAAELLGMFSGKRPGKRVLFCMEPAERKRFDASGHGEAAAALGIEVLECCPLAALSLRPGIGTVLTNSGKLYYYLAGTEYGTTGDCLRACGV
jgi:predicted aconitase